MNIRKQIKKNLKAVAAVFVTAAFAIFFGPFTSHPTAAQKIGTTERPFPVVDFLKFRQFGVLDRPAVSPDGRFVSYGVMAHPERRLGDGLAGRADPASGTPIQSRGVNLFLTDITKDESRLVGTDAGNAIRGSWSPDSKQLAFYSDADGRLKLWVYEVPMGRARKVNDTPIDATTYAGDDPVWTPDGRSVLVPFVESTATKPVTSSVLESLQVLTSGAEIERLRSSVGTRGTDQLDRRPLNSNRAWALVNVATGSARIVISVPVQPTLGTAQISPSGRFVSYLAGSNDLVICRIEDGAIEQVVKGLRRDPAPNLDGPYRWHPTQDRFFYLKQWRVSSMSRAQDGSWQEQPLAHELGEVDHRIFETTRDGKALLLGLRTPGSSMLTGSLAPGIRRLAMVWLDGRPAKVIELLGNQLMKQLLAADRRTAWQPQPGFVTGIVNDEVTFESAIVRLDLTSGLLTKLYSGHFVFQDDRRNRPMVAAPTDHSYIVGQLEGPDRPPDLYRFGVDGKVPTRITEIAPQLSSLRVGPAEVFDTQVVGPTGEKITAYTAVIMPPETKRGDRVPAVAAVYGGLSNAVNINRFGARQGAGFSLAVLLDRGYAVLLLDAPMSMEGARGNPIQDLVNSVVPQVMHAGELGYIDVHRVAVTGQSYGGYCTAALLSATTVFAAGVATSGSYDLIGSYDEGYTEKGQGRMGTHPWEDLPRYIDNSPYLRANRIKSPFLIIHGNGSDDARKMFTALRRLSGTAQLAIYPGQGHSISYWALDPAVDATERIVSFLDQYVKERKQAQRP